MLKPIVRQLPYKTYFKNWVQKNWLSLHVAQSKLKIGRIGFLSLEACKLQLYQLNMFKRNLNVVGKMRSLLWFPTRTFFIPICKKTFRTRMGKGKGKLEYWCCFFLRGIIFVEFDVKTWFDKQRFLACVKNKLPIKAKIIMNSCHS